MHILGLARRSRPRTSRAQEGSAQDPLELALELARGEEGEALQAEGPKCGHYSECGVGFGM